LKDLELVQELRAKEKKLYEIKLAEGREEMVRQWDKEKREFEAKMGK
jgi:5-azacytidine-induced protein 1